VVAERLAATRTVVRTRIREKTCVKQ